MPGDERVIDFAQDPAHLSLSLERMVIRRDGCEEAVIPLADAAVAVVSHPRVTCTGALLAGLMRSGGSMVVCDETHAPVGLMLPLGVNAEQTRRTLAQARAGRPLAKRLWRGIVRAKIRAQAHTLELHTGDDAGLRALAPRVRSGDPENVESTAAQRYWPRLFRNPMFRRRREAPDQNRLLNYGYAVLRAAVGRAVCAAGLHPSLSVHHHGRNNAFALADDLMEPYRALVDDEVAEIVASLGADLPPDGVTKPRLIGVLHARLWDPAGGAPGEHRTVLDWIGRTAASLAQVYLADEGAPREIFYPQGLWRAAPGS